MTQMRTALYGKGTLGKKTYRFIESAEGIDVLCVCEDSVNSGDTGIVLSDAGICPSETDKANLHLVSMLYGQDYIDAVIVATDNELLDFAVRRLVREGIDRIAVLPSFYEDDMYDITDDAFIWVDTDKPRMPYLEYHISFHCNLKCAGCTHFSNLISAPRFGDFESYCNDLIRLQELFWGIGKLRLMGGEPVLNPELPKFIYATREAFPDADIRVVSNGLMIRNDQTDLFEAMRSTGTYFDVSMYPPTASAIDRIADICSSNGVKLTVTPGIHQFMAWMNHTGDSDPADSYPTCSAAHCSYLCNGRISTCAMPQLIDIYNDRFGTDIKPGDGDIIDLHGFDGSGEELIKMLRSPMEMCRYCDKDKRTFDWFVSTDPRKEEWLGTEDR